MTSDADIRRGDLVDQFHDSAENPALIKRSGSGAVASTGGFPSRGTDKKALWSSIGALACP